MRLKFDNYESFFIEDKMYIATTTVGNYSKVLKQIIADWGEKFVFYKERSKTNFGTLPFPARVELSFSRPLPVPYRAILKAYVCASDVKYILDLPSTAFDMDDTTFTDKIQINGEPDVYIAMKEVTDMYWRRIAAEVRKHGFDSNYEFPGKIELTVTSKYFTVQINYK